MSDSSHRAPEPSGWALTGVVFAASVLTLIGCFQVIAGLVAVFDDDFFLVTRNYTFDLDTSAWGWIHLLLGIALVATGFGLFSRRPWAAVTAHRARDAQRGRQLLLHPVLPVLVAARDRARRLGDLGADAPWGDRDLGTLTRPPLQCGRIALPPDGRSLHPTTCRAARARTHPAQAGGLRRVRGAGDRGARRALVDPRRRRARPRAGPGRRRARAAWLAARPGRARGVRGALRIRGADRARDRRSAVGPGEASS